MLRVLLIACLLAAGLAGEEPASDAKLVDRAIRYVNEDVITFGDLVESLVARRQQLNPTNQAEELAMWRALLEDLTNDSLLVQFAESKGVNIEASYIDRLVVEESRITGRGLKLVDMARAHKRIERREKINAAVGFFEARSAIVSPGELLAAYEARKERFKRPARAHVLQIVLRPADPGERTALKDGQSQAFRRAQDADPATAAVVAPLLERLMGLDPESPERAELLDQAIVQLAAIPVDAASPPALSALVADADRLLKLRATLRTPAEVEAQLNDLRSQLDGKGIAAFQKTCKAVSQGPRADEGGDLGWKEPGYFAEELDKAIFALAAGEMTRPVWSQQVCCLSLVSERSEAAQRSFAEVVGELESMLRMERRQAIRAQAAVVLRQRALVRDLAPLEELLGGG